MTRQQPTNPDAKWVLTPLQHSAVDLLAVGTSVTDAAALVGVTRALYGSQEASGGFG